MNYCRPKKKNFYNYLIASVILDEDIFARHGNIAPGTWFVVTDLKHLLLIPGKEGKSIAPVNVSNTKYLYTCFYRVFFNTLAVCLNNVYREYKHLGISPKVVLPHWIIKPTNRPW